MKNKYYLMYKNIPVLKFDRNTEDLKFINQDLLPINILKENESYDEIKTYCSSRMLMTNREYCKEILTSCEIDDQSDISICTISRALSFRDNYWIKEENSKETWESINLYENPFSKDIAITALTGESCSIHIGDQFYTGELTAKGTRAKCYWREENGIYLIKEESDKEIAAEIISHIIAKNMGLFSAKYIAKEVFGKNCSICAIYTNERVEMILARDYLTGLRSEMKYQSAYYNAFMKIDPVNFIKMQIFDYITLNIDRNRDNFAIKKVDKHIIGLYPIYDHDSCFKGKSTKAVYFVTNMTFEKTLNNLIKDYPFICQQILPNIQNLYQYINQYGENLFKTYGLEKEFYDFKKRIEEVILVFERGERNQENVIEKGK